MTHILLRDKLRSIKEDTEARRACIWALKDSLSVMIDPLLQPVPRQDPASIVPGLELDGVRLEAPSLQRAHDVPADQVDDLSGPRGGVLG